jgi:hypothetical protein
MLVHSLSLQRCPLELSRVCKAAMRVQGMVIGLQWTSALPDPSFHSHWPPLPTPHSLHFSAGILSSLDTCSLS